MAKEKFGESSEEERPEITETEDVEETRGAGRKGGERAGHEHATGDVCEECGLTGEEGGRKGGELGEHKHAEGDICRACGLTGEEVGRKGGEHVHQRGDVCEECGLTGEETEGTQ